MKKRFLFLIVLAICSQVMFAQSAPSFEKKREFAQKYFNMKWKLPTGFQLVTDEEIFLMMGQSMDGKKEMTGAVAWGMAKSDDEACCVLYPSVFTASLSLKDGEDAHRLLNHWLRHELYSAVNNGKFDVVPAELTPEMKQRITTLTDADARVWCNADTVYVVDFPVIGHFKKEYNEYNRCVGVFAYKKGGFPMMYKLLFKEDSFAQRNEWEERLKGIITFEDVVWNKPDKKDMRTAYSNIFK